MIRISYIFSFFKLYKISLSANWIWQKFLAVRQRCSQSQILKQFEISGKATKKINKVNKTILPSQNIDPLWWFDRVASFHTSFIVGAVFFTSRIHLSTFSLPLHFPDILNQIKPHLVHAVECSCSYWLLIWFDKYMAEQTQAEQKCNTRLQFSSNYGYFPCMNEKLVQWQSYCGGESFVLSSEGECVSRTEAEQPPPLDHQQWWQWRGLQPAQSLWLLTSVWLGSYRGQRSMEAAFMKESLCKSVIIFCTNGLY